jgi:membrane protease subunit HflK
MTKTGFEAKEGDSSKKRNWRETMDQDDLGYVIRDIWEKHKKKIKAGIVGLLGAITILSSAYTIPQDSEGVVTTFGRYSRTSKPGLNFKIPYSVEHVMKVPTQSIFTESIGFRALKPGVKSEYIDLEAINSGKINESQLADIVRTEGIKLEGDLREQAKSVLRSEYLMLTGDLNMADVEFIIQYRINDPVSYAFNVRDHKSALRDLSEAKMRIAVGDSSVDEVLTTGRTDIETKVKVALQERLNFYKTGLEVVTVKLQSTQPPERVRPSFNEVNSAIATKQEKINTAMAEYNKEIPKAMGEAQAQIKRAEGYAIERVNNSQGDVARFRQIFQQYKNAPEITRTRIYLEAIPDILKNAEKIIYIEEKGGNSDLLLKKLDLNAVKEGGKK